MPTSKRQYMDMFLQLSRTKYENIQARKKKKNAAMTSPPTASPTPTPIKSKTMKYQPYTYLFFKASGTGTRPGCIAPGPIGNSMLNANEEERLKCKELLRQLA